METAEKPKLEVVEKPKKSNKNKVVIIILSVIIVALLCLLIGTGRKMYINITKEEKVQAKNNQLQSQLDSLLSEHNKIKKAYGSLSGKLAEKDSTITAKADEIQKLIASQADYYSIKKKLEYLRGITQGYVSQIDSLYRVNKTLKNENVQITDKYTKEQEKATALAKDKEQLSEKVTLASSLKAYNIKGIPIKLKSGGKKEDVEDKAKRTDRIKVLFTLSENLIAQPGNKTIYIRIARPDDKILTVADDDDHAFDYNGQKIQFSIKQDIDYENKAMDLVMYWDKTDEFIEGTYVVSVFTDGYLIKKGQFVMK
jgi:FtsZ-binding cell division protein ZapB